MTQTLINIIPQDMHDTARVWIFQSSRPLNDKEVLEIDEQLYQFYAQWTSHQAPVKGWAKVLWQRFIVVMADESQHAAVGGCSTDSMMRVIKSLERQYSIDLFNRMSISFLVKDKVEMLPMQQVQYAIDKGYIDGDTLLFNNLVDNKYDLMHHWLVPLRTSWLGSRVTLPA